jgi:hypothetical protein
MGDRIVSRPSTPEYRENHDRIFGMKEEVPAEKEPQPEEAEVPNP